MNVHRKEKSRWKEPKKKPITVRRVAKGIAQVVLETLIAVPDFVNFMVDKKMAYQAAYDGCSHLTRGQFSKAMYGLKRSGYISFVLDKRTGMESVMFTNKGKLRVLDKIVGGVRCDGEFRFVSFDIPEAMRTSRDQFRLAIKQLGFRQIQKSLWVVDRNVGDYVEMAAREYGVEDYVVYIVALRTDIDGIIGKMFSSTGK